MSAARTFLHTWPAADRVLATHLVELLTNAVPDRDEPLTTDLEQAWKVAAAAVVSLHEMGWTPPT